MSAFEEYELRKDAGELGSGEPVECPACSGTDTTVSLWSNRALDEPDVWMLYCRECGNHEEVGS